MCSTNQPFLNGLKSLPTGKKKDLMKIRNWLHTQPHLPNMSDEYIYLFLHACYYNQDKCKQIMETYFTLRNKTPSIFSNRNMDLPAMQTVLGLGYLIRLPQTTPEGYKVLMFSVKDPDYTKLVFADAVKGFCMFNDCVLSEDGLADGYVVIFDMKGVGLGHVARVSLPALKAFMVYIQEAHPARLKQIHILNTANFIHHVMRIVYPLVRSDLLLCVKFHKGSIPEGVPIDILPKEYGGKAPTIKELDAQTKSLAENYRQWLLDTEMFRSDESKRIRKPSFWSMLTGATPVLTPEQQKKNFLQNIQID